MGEGRGGPRRQAPGVVPGQKLPQGHGEDPLGEVQEEDEARGDGAEAPKRLPPRPRLALEGGEPEGEGKASHEVARKEGGGHAPMLDKRRPSAYTRGRCGE